MSGRIEAEAASEEAMDSKRPSRLPSLIESSNEAPILREVVLNGPLASTETEQNFLRPKR